MRFVIAFSLIGLVAFLTNCATAVGTSTLSEENYDLLTVTEGPCAPKTGVGIDPKYRAECKQMTEPRRFRGTWYVDFETSFFTPIGREYCGNTKAIGDCVELTGAALPWPKRSDCGLEYKVEFVGRRNLLPHNYEGSAFRIMVDKVLSAKRLPDPPNEGGECGPAAS